MLACPTNLRDSHRLTTAASHGNCAAPCTLPTSHGCSGSSLTSNHDLQAIVQARPSCGATRRMWPLRPTTRQPPPSCTVWQLPWRALQTPASRLRGPPSSQLCSEPPTPRRPPGLIACVLLVVITPCEAGCLHRRGRSTAWPQGGQGSQGVQVALQLGAEQDCLRSRIGCAPTQALRLGFRVWAKSLQKLNNMSKAADEHPMHACGCRSTQRG